MGMFDIVYCDDFPLPLEGFQHRVFQTKSIDVPGRFGPYLDFFRIREDGLIVRLGDYDDENNLEYEQHRATKGGQILNYLNGDVYFYTYFKEPSQGWVEFVATVKEGRVTEVKIVRLEEE